MDVSLRTLALRERLLALLARRGPSGSTDLIRELGVSQPTFSRLVASLGSRILSFGQARGRRYALPREIPDVRQPMPVYEVRPRGEAPVRFGELYAVGDRGFCLVSRGGVTFTDDLPWFLQNLRPSGFLGRLTPRRHPELDLPDDIRFWTGDHVVRFATRFGWDPAGAFLLGDEACSLFLHDADRPPNLVDASRRQDRYPAIVADLLAFGDAGSSAAGEQPKFLATRRDGRRLTPVLVKYSPPARGPLGRRVADLLVAEHLALEVLGARGFDVPRSAVLSCRGRTFVELERFDRDGARFRTGQVTLEVLDAEFAGTDRTGWGATTGVLASRGVVPVGAVASVRWLETFGRLIGNTDMHAGNLAFRMDGLRVTGLAPVYDMVPMHYHPQAGESRDDDYGLPRLGPDMGDVARPSLDAAIDFWTRVGSDPRVSPSFRRIASRNARRLAGLRPIVDALPVAAGRSRG